MCRRCLKITPSQNKDTSCQIKKKNKTSDVKNRTRKRHDKTSESFQRSKFKGKILPASISIQTLINWHLSVTPLHTQIDCLLIDNIFCKSS